MNIATPPYFDRHLELAKWIAIGTMVVDHVGLLLFKDYLFLRLIGRLAFPLFCWIIALRLAEKPERSKAYMKRLFVWFLISQLPFAIAFHSNPEGDILRSLGHTLNIMATLGVGVGIFHLLRRLQAGGSPALWLGVLALLFIGGKCDYGVAGVAAIPILALAAEMSLPASAILAGFTGAASNLLTVAVFYSLSKSEFYWQLVVFALLSGVIAFRCLESNTKIPRLPGWFFYAFYPLHITILVAIVVARSAPPAHP